MEWLDLLPSHLSTFFGTATTCLCALLAMVDIMMITLLSACVTYIGAQIAELFCKLAVHRHQCCRCPTNSCAFSVDLSTACHHLHILFSEIRCSTKFTCFCAAHAGIYAALPFCVLKCCSRRHMLCVLMVIYRIYRQSTVQIEQK